MKLIMTFFYFFAGLFLFNSLLCSGNCSVKNPGESPNKRFTYKMNISYALHQTFKQLKLFWKFKELLIKNYIISVKM